MNISDVASSLTILGFQGLPQNSLNHRVTIFLLSCDIRSSPFARCWFREEQNQPRLDLGSKPRGHPPRHPISDWSQCRLLRRSRQVGRSRFVTPRDLSEFRNVIDRPVIGWLAAAKLLACLKDTR